MRGIEIHDKREKGVSHSNPDINFEMSDDNYNIHDFYGPHAEEGSYLNKENESNSYNTAITNRLAQLNTSKRIRKDAVVMAQALITTSPDAWFMRGYRDNDWPSQEAMERYFADAYRFIAKKYGTENIISAYAHFDEATPHLHINFVPITSDGRLSAKDLFARKTKELHKLQTEFYDEVGIKYGLVRGEEGSKSKHKSVAKYKLDKTMQQISNSETHLANINTEIVDLYDERAELHVERGNLNDEIANKLAQIKRYDQLLYEQLLAEQSKQHEPAMEQRQAQTLPSAPKKRNSGPSLD